MGGPFPDPLVMCAQVKAQGMVRGGALLDATLPPPRARSASEVGAFLWLSHLDALTILCTPDARGGVPTTPQLAQTRRGPMGRPTAAEGAGSRAWPTHTRGCAS